MLNTLCNITKKAKKEYIDFSKKYSFSSDTSDDTDVEADGYDFIKNNNNNDVVHLTLSKTNKSKKQGIIFRALDTLTKTEPYLKINEKVEICLFRIVKDSYKPYLLYGLYQDDDKTLRFPFFKYTGGLVSHYAMNEMNTVIKKENHNKSYQLDYKGYSRSKNGVKLWIECDNFTYSLETNKLTTKLRWGMVSEIINQRKILELIVRPEVTHFLLEKPEYIFIYDQNENVFETPIVGYVGGYYKKIISIAAIGKEQEDAVSDTGVCYKFTTYNSALRDAFWTSNYSHKKINNKNITTGNMGRYKRGGLARFILFLGKHTMYEGIPIKNWRNDYDSISDGFDIYVATEQQYKALSYYEIDTDQNIKPTTIHNANITY